MKELLALRTQLGMNQTKFAEFLNVPYRTYIKWEAGTNPPSAIALTTFKMLQFIIDNGLLEQFRAVNSVSQSDSKSS